MTAKRPQPPPNLDDALPSDEPLVSPPPAGRGIWVDWRMVGALTVAGIGFAGWLTRISVDLGKVLANTSTRIEGNERRLDDHETRIRVLERGDGK